MNHNLKIVLYNPQIHWNTGAIGRTCVALGAELHIVHPCGFEFDEKEIKRAGLDYWEHVQLKHFDDWQHFCEQEKPQHDELFFLSTKANQLYFDAEIKHGAYLVFGSETSGLPDAMHEKYADRLFKLPMYSEHIRSLNLANTATAVMYEAVRQIALR